MMLAFRNELEVLLFSCITDKHRALRHRALRRQPKPYLQIYVELVPAQ